MLSTQRVHGQVSSPTHVYILLAVMEGDAPSSWISDMQRTGQRKKTSTDDTVYPVKGLLS